MRIGTVVSVIAHGGLIAWGVLALAQPPIDASKIESIPVSLVTIDDVTKAPKANPLPTPKPAPVVPPLPQPAPAVADVAPQPKPVVVPAPAVASTTAPQVANAEPKPAVAPPAPAPSAETPAPLVVAAATPAPVVPPRPRVAPAPSPTPAKPATTAPAPIDEIAAVLDKTPPTPVQPRPASAQPQAEPAQPPSDSTGLDALIASATVDPHMTASEVDALIARITSCWTPPPGWIDPAEVRVVVLISLKRDGSIGAAPEVVQAPVGRYAQTAPESAVRAVLACAPYVLPAAKYEDWKDVQITFDPRAMATG